MRYSRYIYWSIPALLFFLLWLLLRPIDWDDKPQIIHITEPISDYGELESSVKDFSAVSPDSLEEVAEIIRHANQQGTRIRIRGAGHSTNASSLPRTGELLILTKELRHFRFDQEGSITIGAGIRPDELAIFLKTYDYLLPVYNDGGIGPTFGGLMAGGGIGLGASRYGGFWENVLEIRLVTGSGKIMTLRPNDELFPWMFGSLGELGIFVEMKLKILSSKKVPYPMGKHGVLPRISNIKPIDLHGHFNSKLLYWFTLFVPSQELEPARSELVRLMKEHPNTLKYLPLYEYPIKFLTFNPKLVYPFDRDFVAIGIWGNQPKQEDTSALWKLERDIMKLAMANRDKGYRRYIQTEIVAPKSDYREHLGESLYNEFLSLKKQLDPNFTLGCNTFFRCPTR